MRNATLPFHAAVFALLANLPGGQPAAAQDTGAGQQIYQAHCAACHGLEGRGDGPMGHVLKVPAANLTLIAARNGGIYPVQRVYEIIEGSTVIAAHDTHGMPRWGDLERQDAMPGRTPIGSDVAQLRILSVVYYLRTLQ